MTVPLLAAKLFVPPPGKNLVVRPHLLEIIALFILASMAVIGAVKAAMIGFDGERIPEDFALLVSGLYGLVIGLVVL